jgi:hypothetical protein
MRGRPKVSPPTLTRTWYDSQAFEAQWVWPGNQAIEPGDSSGPRLSAIGEYEYNCPRTWPAQYGWTLMGLGAMPRFQLGYTAPTFNNQLSPMSQGYNMVIPGLSRTPFGGN